MTRGRPAKRILLFTLPLLIGNIFQQFYSMADTLIVGRTLGVTALAAVGCTGSISFLILGFAQGLTAGLSIVTAQRFGAQDTDGVRRSFAVSILISAATTVALTAASVLLAGNILVWMHTPADLTGGAYDYIIVILGGIAASMFFNLFSNILRALGDSRTPLLLLVAACVLNILLDFVFILVFHMGVAGAGWATVLSQAVSCAGCVAVIARKFPLLHIRRTDWRCSRRELLDHCRTGFPMGFQSSIIAIGAIAIQFALNTLGSTAVAAYTAAGKIDQIATQPMMSFGMTMATYSAQNYGAGRVRRISQGVRQCLLMSVLFSVGMGALVILLGKPMVRLFVGGAPEVIDLAQVYLVINGVPYFLLAVLFVVRYTLQGLGQSMVPTIAGVMELLMRILAASVLVRSFGFAGASASNPLAWLGSVVVLLAAYFYVMRRLRREFPEDPPAAPA